MKITFLKSFFNWYDNKTSIFKFLFCGILFSLFLATFLNIPFYKYVVNQQANTQLLISFFLILFFNYFLIFTLFSIRFIGRVLIFIVLLISLGVWYYMQYLGGCISYEVIVATMETSRREALEFLPVSVIIMLLVFAIVVGFVVHKLKFHFEKFYIAMIVRLISILFCLVCSLILIWANYSKLALFVRHNSDTICYINIDNYIGNTFRYLKDKIGDTKIVREEIDANPVIKRENNRKKFIVLLVGETSRAMNYSLNGYERDTNPYLKKYLQDGSLVNFENATSCGTATGWSVPCMFDYRTRKQFNKKKYYENVLSLTGKAGVSQIWYENDDGAKMQQQRCEYVAVQTRKHPLCSNNECKDEILIEDLDNEIKKFSGNNDRLMIMHMIGSHGSLYYLRYTDKFAKFKPECKKNNTHECSKEELYNAYDNTILYQDWVISQMIEKLQKMKQNKKNENVDITLWFMSDHGESLGEHGFYLHAFPYSIAPKEQTHIPFFIWTTDDKLRKTLQEKAKLNKEGKFDVSHDNLFYTLLGLLNVESKVKNDALDLTK